MMKERKIFQPLPSSGICAAYNLLLEEGLVSFPITRDAEVKIEAIVANITGNYFGTSLYETVEEKVVAYLYFLINDHPFTDGNKRTATLSFLILCNLNTLEPQFESFTLDQLAVYVEKAEGDHQILIKEITRLLFKTE